MSPGCVRQSSDSGGRLSQWLLQGTSSGRRISFKVMVCIVLQIMIAIAGDTRGSFTVQIMCMVQKDIKMPSVTKETVSNPPHHLPETIADQRT